MTTRIGTAELVGKFTPGSPEWLAARAHGLGGSEIAAVLGMSPFESRYSLWHRKANMIGPVAESPEMEWGTRLEDAVARKFADENTDLHVLPEGTYRNIDRPWQIANPDRLCWLKELGVSEDPISLLEVKTSPFGDNWGAETDAVPMHVRCQVLWYLDTFGLKVAHVAVLISGLEYRQYVVTHDQADAQVLRDAAVEFLDTLAAGTPPPIDDHKATYDAVREMHPDIEPVSHELSDEAALDFLRARSVLRDAEAVERQAKSSIADEMGSAHTAWWRGFKIATRQARGDGLPYVVTAKNLPDPNAEDAAA